MPEDLKFVFQSDMNYHTLNSHYMFTVKNRDTILSYFTSVTIITSVITGIKAFK
jgi:heme/copper-type cytochrome/quinol oxidase subunit 1